MDFRSIANTLQNTQSRTSGKQAEMRPLWLDKYGQNFVELVLGDLQEDFNSLKGTTEEAANQQMKNIQSRQLNHDHIAAATGRDAAQQNANQQQDSQIGSLIAESQATLPQADEINQACQKLRNEIEALNSKIYETAQEAHYDFII